MKKRLRILAFILFFMSLIGISDVYSKELYKPSNGSDSVNISIDSSKNGEMPKRFRKDTELKASGSAQFTGGNIDLMKKAIGSSNITVVDLRQESHGFINDMAVSWKPKGSNKANKGLTKKQVIKDEKKKLKSVEPGKPIMVEDKKIIPEKVQSEKELVEEHGMDYIRIPVTDTERPEDEMVDYFVDTVRKLPEDTWLHFHCKAGIGRTTTFMTMYDIMKNAKKDSLEDIMERQVLLGGKNLLKPEDGKESESHRRSDLIRNFYKYAKSNNDNYETSWTQWLRENS
ncbi:MAG: phosphatase [Clostridium sp.]|jgi:protein-tyrosine phosphatase|uniref:phosphatase domain-containing putative toxin n=1 Tax=Clostridium sp. TaxID=1506 RepID=UPI0025B9B232|nr:phosphatase [Clostridium sp.]MCH3965067.1 phosphatase [Clostridium sp.]MCI1714288.1 phosphatase [Clostridium sp.]MCI1798550.1 phosphatase [Clostridium sp.]MCI1812719.1 phosphatase [Clostridium sp.]MCI1869359.1 phosphatase [Clostridium sp.]